MSLEFHLVSEESADSYLEFVRRIGPVKLGDLAHLMAGSAGPVERMDGSCASLLPLWEWFLQFRNDGLPGVPANATPSYAQFLGYDAIPHPRSQFVGEAIAHYLVEVIRGRFADARWGFDEALHENTISYHEPKVLTPSGWWDVESIGTRFARSAEEREAARVPGRLLDKVTATLGDLEEWPVPSSQSILIPLLREPPIPWNDPRRTPPRSIAAVVPDDGSWTMPESGEILAIALDDPERPAEWQPIPEDPVATELARRGWRAFDGGPIRPELLRTDHQVLFWGDRRAALYTIAEAGRCRGFAFEVVSIADDEYLTVVSGLNDIAATIGGHFGPFEDWYPDGVPGERA